MINFNVEYVVKHTKEANKFKMVLDGLAFKFEDLDSKKLINPFFCTKRQIEIAKVILSDDSAVINNPKNIMEFETDALLITVTSEDL